MTPGRRVGSASMHPLARPRNVAVAGAVVVALGLLGLGQVGDWPTSAAASSPIEIWHGAAQKVGHLGNGQPDFNLMGRIEDPQRLLSLQYTLNGSIPVELNFRRYRRLAADGHFNADIPVTSLAPGPNRVEIEARFLDGEVARATMTLTRLRGRSPLPDRIDWAAVADPQDVGQYVDGHWRIGEDGLRPAHVGYDRLFLIGDESWRDYEVTALVTLHEVAPDTGPVSGGNGLGVVMRFAGHVIGGPRRFPVAQPKWGYQPFGAIAWLRWQRGRPDGPAFKQFLRGDGNDKTDHDSVVVRAGETYRLKALCQTLPDDAEGRGVSRYAFKFWSAAADEPTSWDWEHVQVSRDALRHGGVALVAHHVDASFGDITIVPIEPALPSF
jgi:hypothetical protein